MSSGQGLIINVDTMQPRIIYQMLYEKNVDTIK